MGILINNLSKSYERLQVISSLNLSFESKGIYCLLGPSGCGKTTLLNIIAGLISADFGSIEGLDGKKISYVFQEDRLIPWLTVYENILFVLENRYNKNEADEIIDRYISLVGLDKFKNSRPQQLSGGMKQRAAIARALAYDGDVFVMDEPFKGLDMERKRQLMDYIAEHCSNKSKLVIFISHDIDEALYMADNIYVFHGPPLELIRDMSIDINYSKRDQEKLYIKQYRDMLMGR